MTAPTLEISDRNAQRGIETVKTNISLLRGIVAHPDFINGKIDIQRLGLNLDAVLQQRENLSKTPQGLDFLASPSQQVIAESGLPTSNPCAEKEMYGHSR